MTMVTLTIDGEEVTVTEDTTITDAAKKAHTQSLLFTGS